MLDLVFYIIIAFISLLALGQGQNYIRARTIKRYFKSNDLRFILVCEDSNTRDHWIKNIDKVKFDRIEIISIEARETNDKFMMARLLETTVRKAGVMRYPCLLTIEDEQIKGQHFEMN